MAFRAASSPPSRKTPATTASSASPRRASRSRPPDRSSEEASRRSGPRSICQGRLREGGLGDDLGARLPPRPLLPVGMGTKEALRDEESENAVAEELQGLVVQDLRRRLGLVRERRVGQGPDEEPGSTKRWPRRSSRRAKGSLTSA